jgi:hypothetical protein
LAEQNLLITRFESSPCFRTGITRLRIIVSGGLARGQFDLIMP